MTENENLSPVNSNHKADGHSTEHYPRPENYERTLSRIYLIATIFMILTIIDSLFQYGDFGAWQILADAGGIFTGLIILRISHWYFRKKQYRLSESLIPLVIFIAYVPGDLFLEGVTSYNAVSGVLVILICWMIIRPRNKYYWLVSTIILVVAVYAFSQIEGLSRFDISQSDSWQASLPIFTLVITFALLFQFVQNLQHTTIRIRRIVVLLSLGLIPTIIALTASSTIVYEQTRNDEIETLENIAFFKEDQLTDWKEREGKYLSNLANQEGIIENFLLFTLPTTNPTIKESSYNSLHHDLDLAIGGSLTYETLAILDLSGNVIVSTDTTLEGENQSNQDFFIHSQGEAYYQPPTLDEVKDEIVVRFTNPIYNQIGSFLGIIVADVNINSINEILAETSNLGETGKAYLISADNILLTDVRNSEGITSGGSLITSPGGIFIPGIKDSNSGLYTNFQDEPVIGVYHWLPELNFSLIVEKNQSEAFGNFRSLLLINITIVAVVIAILIGASFRITRDVLDPLQTLTENAKKFTAGEIDTIEKLKRKDEIGELSNALNQMANQIIESMEHMEDIIVERTETLEQRAVYLEAIAEISQVSTGIHELDNLLTNVTHLISEKFGFYHVGIFLIDEAREYAVLKGTNSDGGWRMLARNHKLKIGEQGIVGNVTGTKKPRIQQRVVGDDSVYFDNPDLPMTQSEMALPLIVGGELIGALDVQSTVEEAFKDEDIAVLQVLADEVAIAINNTHLFEQLQESLKVERKLYGDISKEAWTKIQMGAEEKLNVKSDESGVRVISKEIGPESSKAIREGVTVQSELSEDGQKYLISVPVKIRGGGVVGVLETYKSVDAGPWISQEIKVLEAISEQLGIALENARLFDETQRLAHREVISSDVVSRIWASTNIDTIMQTAIQELGRALKVSQGAIHLKFPETRDTSGKQPEEIGD
jgi:GAF domain-containing protein/HAMP domain-containing protein